MSRRRYQLLNVKERLRRPRTGPRGPFRKRWSQPAYKPGSVRPATLAGGRRDGHSSGTAVTGRLEQPTRMAGPEDGPEPLRAPPSLFGFAPGGACHAAAVTGRAVRSYRTLSPLPPRRASTGALARPRAVCFLWRFPWGYPRRTLSGAVSPWSPDFPPRERGGRPADWLHRDMGIAAQGQQGRVPATARSPG